MFHFKCFLFVVFLCTTVFCENKDADSSKFTIELNADNFVDAIAERNHFIMFYTPWCGHSKKLFPIWEQLAETFNVRDEPRLIIGKVDCTENHELCVENDVTGYPTLKFFKPNAVDSPKFKGIRDLGTITKFINEMLGDAAPKEDEDEGHGPEVVQQLAELTDDTFNKHVAIGKHFVKFYAPWCGHCQRLAPTWDELAKSLEYENSVKIAKIDCTAYRQICQEFEVKGYPTLLWIEDGKKVEKYTGSRSHEDLKAYVNKMVGTTNSGSTSGEDGNDDSSNVAILSGNNFKHAIEVGITFVKFYAPWCGHCQKMAPVWEELAVKFIGNDQVKIAKVDCTEPTNKELCMNEQVEGYPTLFIYVKGEKVAEYNGSRQLNDLHDFVTRHVPHHDEL